MAALKGEKNDCKCCWWRVVITGSVYFVIINYLLYFWEWRGGVERKTTAGVVSASGCYIVGDALFCVVFVSLFVAGRKRWFWECYCLLLFIFYIKGEA